MSHPHLFYRSAGLAILLKASWVSAGGSAPPLSEFPTIPISRFQQVAPGIFRGGKFDVDGLRALKLNGIRSVISLEGSPSEIDFEMKSVQEAGMNFLAYPMSPLRRPPEAQMHKILKNLGNSDLYPIFIHCKQGKDRTGLMVALFRVKQQKWSPRDAYLEMMGDGFNPIYLGLLRAFKQESGGESLAFSDVFPYTVYAR